MAHTGDSVICRHAKGAQATSEHLQAGPLLVMVPLKQEHFAIKASCNYPVLIQEAKNLQVASRNDASP